MKISEDIIRIIFGLKIKQLRVEKGLSLTELAKISGLSLSYLNEIEKGKKYPKANKIMSLSEHLGAPYDQLVSLKLNRSLAPLGELLQSNVFKEIPFDLFGIQLNKIIEVIAGEPSKAGTFITTLLEIARSNDLSQEKFYLAALRSYQESQDNYFEDLEAAADAFATSFQLDQSSIQKPEVFAGILEKDFGYKIDYNSLGENNSLRKLRSMYVKKSKPTLLVNNELTSSQKAFTFARELAYNVLGFKERATTTTWFKVESFEQLLNHFKASYFAGALLIGRQYLLKDLKSFFNRTEWDKDAFLGLITKYTTSPETFMFRLTNLLPKYFDLKDLFFLRFNTREHRKGYFLTKELHLSQLHSPHGNERGEHYCRRWISLNVLKKLDKLRLGGNTPRFIAGAQISNYSNSKNQYFIIATARPSVSDEQTDCSVSIGFLMNKEFKRKVKFWKDPEVRHRTVNETCERCAISDCEERKARPIVIEQQMLESDLVKEIELFRKEVS